jgi:hypothetical protein
MRRIFKIFGGIPGCPPDTDEQLSLSVFHLAKAIAALDFCALRILFFAQLFS